MLKIGNFYFNTLLVLFFICFLGENFARAESCEDKDIFKKYECRIKNYCAVPEYTENKKIFNPEKFKKAEEYKEVEIADVFLKSSREEKPIKKGVSIYKENMNSIYKCAMIGIQKNSIQNIKDKLLKIDKTGDIKKNVGPKIDNIINRLTLTSTASKCLEIDKSTIFNKLSILKQTTQVTCEYGFYIDYLKDYYKDPANVVDGDNQDKDNTAVDKDSKDYKDTISYINTDVANKLKNIDSDLQSEFEHSIKIFPIAFHAYSEYENNFPIHFLLDLVREDYIIFRDKLHEVLNPINQVGYKIVNAMKK